ncbi:LysE family translocator [Paraferrimonas sedimenticola]|uniref:Amino acid efflux permease RhtB family protein n=1 Tax=Paraferrimonas sedimenticola TaxID=375674 RepID=A0AA37RZ85_9GAMM|nr:LysE family translocator [Paraferrimonas sedimenticola]GLP97267.1 amino acid efflux permease RhtB family protein [Paraferrimonas sedimenticola]
MSFTDWLPLLMVCALGAMSPGPSLAMVLRHTLAGGRDSGLIAAWTHALGIGIYAALTVAGLSWMIQQQPLVFQGISLAGAAYLAWLGFQALSAKQGIAAKLASGESASRMEAARDGFAIAVLNPKILLFFVALFGPFVQASLHTGQQMTLIATPLVVDGLWYSLVALGLSHGAVLERLRRQAHWLDRISGVILIGLALKVVWGFVSG